MNTPLEQIPGALKRWRQAIDVLPGVLGRFSEAEGETRPSPERWSRKEVLGHLIDSAANNHQRFVRGQIAGSRHFPEYEQEQWVRVQHYQTSPWAELITLWRAYNSHLLRVVEAMPEEGRRAICRVGEGPEVTVAWLIVDYVDHLEHHLRKMLGAWPMKV